MASDTVMRTITRILHSNKNMKKCESVVVFFQFSKLKLLIQG